MLHPSTVRIVVSLRIRHATDATDGQGPHSSGALQGMRVARERAEALGGTLCAFGPGRATFDFAADELEEALLLASIGFDGPSGIRWSVGIAEGGVARLIQSGSIAPAFGAAVAISEALAAGDHDEPILVHSEMACVVSSDLATGASVTCIDGTVGRVLERCASRGSRRPSASRSPPSADTVNPSESVPRNEANDADDRTGKKGNRSDLDIAARRGAALQLVREGRPQLALQVLREEALVGMPAAAVERGKLRLAHAMALIGSGFLPQGAIETLQALSFLRRANDRRGETLCLRLLSQTSRTAGHPDAAVLWDQAAQASELPDNTP